MHCASKPRYKNEIVAWVFRTYFPVQPSVFPNKDLSAAITFASVLSYPAVADQPSISLFFSRMPLSIRFPWPSL